MTNRPRDPNYYPEDDENTYPPKNPNNYPPQGSAGNYPPPNQGGIDLDDPRFGGGVPAPQRGQDYPPQGGSPQYPPPQQQNTGGYPPPNRDQGGGNRPSQGGSYPPQGNTGGYPPPDQGHQGGINLDDPRFGGQGYPPQGGAQQQSYPPPQQQNTGNYSPPSGTYQTPDTPSGKISLDDPRFGGSSGQSSGSYREPERQDYGSGAGRQSIDLDDPRYGGEGAGALQEGRGRSRRGREDDEPRQRRQLGESDDEAPSGGLANWALTERQIEYLAWGSTVILLGISLMRALTGASDALTFVFPLLAGGILTASAIYQRVVMGWHVGILTWFTAIMLVSYTITLQVAGDGTGIFSWIGYFLGTIIIMTGVTVLLQAFRRPSDNSRRR